MPTWKIIFIAINTFIGIGGVILNILTVIPYLQNKRKSKYYSKFLISILISSSCICLIDIPRSIKEVTVDGNEISVLTLLMPFKLPIEVLMLWFEQYLILKQHKVFKNIKDSHLMTLLVFVNWIYATLMAVICQWKDYTYIVLSIELAQSLLVLSFVIACFYGIYIKSKKLNSRAKYEARRSNRSLMITHTVIFILIAQFFIIHQLRSNNLARYQKLSFWSLSLMRVYKLIIPVLYIVFDNTILNYYVKLVQVKRRNKVTPVTKRPNNTHISNIRQETSFSTVESTRC